MAVKDQSLDDKIRNAAMEEFIKHGYLAASLHKIADRAGVTTGALYTRYKNKDDLFGSLLKEIFDLFQSMERHRGEPREFPDRLEETDHGGECLREMAGGADGVAHRRAAA